MIVYFIRFSLARISNISVIIVLLDFVFKESPLKSVVEQLSKAYHTPIAIEGADLKNKKLTAHLRYQTPDSALNVIAATLQCKLENSGGSYTLSGK